MTSSSAQSQIELAKDYLASLLRTERAPQSELASYQAHLLAALYKHAQESVPYYSHLPQLPQPIDVKSDTWLGTPFVSRHDLANHEQKMRTTNMPLAHGLVNAVQSGGSTGNPIRVDLSALEGIARVVSTYRMFKSWDLDTSLPLMMIRKPQLGSGRTDAVGFRKWGYPWLSEDDLGDRIHLDIHEPVSAQLDAIERRAPTYLNTLPSNIMRLGIAARSLGMRLDVPVIISVAEYLPHEIRKLSRDVFGSRLINVLSSSEGGIIAIECPETGLLHMQDEMVLTEIIKGDGSICEVGEVGELVVTPLYNYASPLIRYRSGDFVRKGPTCSCGRTLPTITEVVGRREHMFSFPNGTQRLPDIDRVGITEKLGHEEWMFVQTSNASAELRLGKGTNREKLNKVLSMLQEQSQNVFSLQVSHVSAIPLTSGGKRHFTLNESMLKSCGALGLENNS